MFSFLPSYILTWAFLIFGCCLNLVATAQNHCDSLLTAFYQFENAAFDESGNDHHAILSGSAKISNSLNIPADDESALFMPNFVLQGALDFSFTCRVLFTKIQEDQPDPINVILNGFSINNALVIGYRKPGNVIHLTFQGVGIDIPLSFEPVENQWYCFVFVRLGDVGRVFLDGVEIGEGVHVGGQPLEINSLLLGQDQDCVAGCFAANQSLAGKLDNVRFYRRSLSESEIQALCVFSEINATICEGEEFEGYSIEGVFDDIFQGWEGCDSMRLLHLNVIPTEDTSFSVTICQGENFEGFAESGIYTKIFSSSEGCDSVVSFNLSVIPGIYTPNAFSPNGDGVNDFFTLYGGDENSIILELKIFGRWGELLFEVENIFLNQPDLGWNGKFRGKICNPGMYIWFAAIKLSNDKTVFKKGDVILVTGAQ